MTKQVKTTESHRGSSRHHCVAHVPDYGLGDLSKVYRHLPASSHQFKREIKTTLLAYEPRLKAIDIELHDTEPGMLLSFTMTCHLHQLGLVRYGTHFMPDGRTRLKLLKANLDRD